MSKVRRAKTLIKLICKLGNELVENYSIEEVNEAYKAFKRDWTGDSNYICDNIYIPQGEED